jgi:hypothetical protein
MPDSIYLQIVNLSSFNKKSGVIPKDHNKALSMQDRARSTATHAPHIQNGDLYQVTTTDTNGPQTPLRLSQGEDSS